jgi:AraC family transcriptional regulator
VNLSTATIAGTSVEAWVAAFSGRGNLWESVRRDRSNWVSGWHRFPVVKDFVTPPVLDQHYVGALSNGPLKVEADREGTRRSTSGRQGTIFLVSAGESVGWRWDKPTEEKHIFFRPKLMQEVSRECGVTQAVFPEDLFAQDDTISAVVSELVERDSEPGPDRVLSLEYGLRFLIYCLVRKHCRLQVARATPSTILTSRQMRRLEIYVEEHISADITLDDLAEQVNLSKFHFCRTFKATLGLPPHSWLTEKRMNRARLLLRDTSLPILEIANAVGYESQSHFGQMFKKRFGTSPLRSRF